MPPTNGEIDVQGIKFDDARNSTSPLGRKDSGSRAAKRVENDAIPAAAVADQICDQRHGFNGWMELKITPACRVKTVDARIVQHVGAVAPLCAKPEVVDMWLGPGLENSDQFVFGAIKAAKAAITLVPNQQVLPLGIKRQRCAEQLMEVPPINDT